MADMRLDDWLIIFGTAGKLLLILIGGFFLIVLWPRIVSSVSRFHARMTEEGAARRAYRQRVYDHQHMSSNKVSRTLFPIEGNARSYAVEHGSEQDGTGGMFRFPSLWEQLGTLSDDELLDILARVKDANGNPKYADSRIAKFIGGRVEDRVAQVRAVRGTEPPPPKPQPLLKVRDNGMERLIAKYGK
jgi:hypothetical protein